MIEGLRSSSLQRTDTDRHEGTGRDTDTETDRQGDRQTGTSGEHDNKTVNCRRH